MNKLVLPPSPNWYQSNVMACAPDNTLMYGARDDLIVIKPSPADEPEDVRCLPLIHSSKVISVNINKNWGAPNKYAVTVSQDSIVKVWDIDTLERKCFHNKHLCIDPNSKLVGASFAGDDRVVSVSESGTIVIWDLIRNETNVLSTLFPYTKVEITCLSVCPHASWLVAFGLESGIIAVADLRKTGKILYSLRGHKKPVVSLTWCPAPVNIFPKRPHNRVVEKKPTESPEMVQPSDSSAIVTFSDTSRRKQKCPRKEPLCWTEYFYVDELVQTRDYNSYWFEMTTRLDTRKDKKSIHNASLKANCRRKKKFNLNEYFAKKNVPIIHPREYWFLPKEEDESSGCEHGEEECLKNESSPKETVEVENWRTKQPEHCEEEPRKEFLLASSAREQQIYIWRAGTDGRMQTFITVPTSKWRNKKRGTTHQKNWITLCWATPQILLSSSNDAALLQWTLPKPLDEAKQLRTVHKEHWSALFTIKAPIVYLNEYNFLQERELNVWTTGMDRKIVNTDLKSSKRLSSYPGLGGSVLCIAGSPLDPNRLAIGTGEPMLNIWDVGLPHKKNIIFSSFYHNLSGSITALAWHPTVETTLAWGSVYGLIGVLDVGSKSKISKRLPAFFDNQIYKLEWGPLDPDTEVQKLFAVSEGKIGIFDPKSTNKSNPELLELPQDALVYTMAWKPDYTKLLVSTKSGTLLTYSPDLQLLSVAYLTQKLQTILWHPDAVTDDFAVSQYCNMFAGTIKSNEFVIFDLNATMEYNEEAIIHQYPNRRKITCMTWSPHAVNHLLFGDEMGVAQIYDIESRTIVCTYINPDVEAMLSVHWSPSDPDLIIAGTISHKIYVWSVSENHPMDPKDITVVRNKMVRALHKEIRDPGNTSKERQSPDNGGGKSQKKSSIMPLFYSPKEDRREEDLEKLLDWKLGKPTQKDDMKKLFEVNKPLDPNDVDVLEVFGNQCDLENLLKRNATLLKQNYKYDKADMLSLFKGDISVTLKDAIGQKRVNPWIISMCPMVSPMLWQTACDMYVQQLLEDSKADPMEIVSYLLARHKVQEAVDFLCERQLFREAFVLAKTRFGADKATASDVLDQWAKHCVYQGNFELAAACYITLGKLVDAASVLFRRTNVGLLELAVRLADMTDNEELHRAVQFRLKAFKTKQERIDEGCNEDIPPKPLVDDETFCVSFEEESKDDPEVDLSIVKKEKNETTALETLKIKRMEMKKMGTKKEASKIETDEKSKQENSQIELKTAERTEDPEGKTGFKTREDKTKKEESQIKLQTKVKVETILKTEGQIEQDRETKLGTEETTEKEESKMELKTADRTNVPEGKTGFETEEKPKEGDKTELETEKETKFETEVKAKVEFATELQTEGIGKEKEAEFQSEKQMKKDEETEFQTEKKSELGTEKDLQKEKSEIKLETEAKVEVDTKLKTKEKIETEDSKIELKTAEQTPKGKTGFEMEGKIEAKPEEKVDIAIKLQTEEKEFQTQKKMTKEHSKIKTEPTNEPEGKTGLETEKGPSKEEIKRKLETKANVETKLQTDGKIVKGNEAGFQSEEQIKKDEEKEFQAEKKTTKEHSKIEIETKRTNESEGKTVFETEGNTKEEDSKSKLETETKVKIGTKLEIKEKLKKEKGTQTEEKTKKGTSETKLEPKEKIGKDVETDFQTTKETQEDKTGLETEQKAKKEEESSAESGTKELQGTVEGMLDRDKDK